MSISPEEYSDAFSFMRSNGLVHDYDLTDYCGIQADQNPNLPEANDQQPPLEELGPEYAEWLDDIEDYDYYRDRQALAYRGYDDDDPFFDQSEIKRWNTEGDYFRGMAVDENGEI